MRQPASPLARVQGPQGSPDADPATVTQAARKLWRVKGQVLVDPEALPEPLRSGIIAYAERHYGKRGRA